MKRRNIYSDPKSLNTKISSIIRKTINLTRCLICFTDIGFYPTNIFIFATESLQFRYVYVLVIRGDTCELKIVLAKVRTIIGLQQFHVIQRFIFQYFIQ